MNRILQTGWILIVAIIGIAGCKRDPKYRFQDQPVSLSEEADAVSSKHPKLAVSSSGTLYLLAVVGDDEGSRLSLLMSHDGGDTFMAPVPVSEAGARVSSHGQNSPSLARTATQIYALWEQHNPSGPADLVFARSVDFGHSFVKPIAVTDKSQKSFNGFAAVAVAPNGDIYAAWLDSRDAAQPEGTFTLYLARSDDHGATFRKNVAVARAACPCCRPSIAFGPNGDVLIAWRRVFPRDVRDIVVSRSNDRGATFTEPVRVAEDNWVLRACPDSGPATATVGSRTYVAWLSEGGGRPGIRLAWSDDAGRSFAPARIASSGVLDANHPSLSASEDGRVVLVFEGRDVQQKQGWGPRRPYLVEINGTRVSDPVPVPSAEASATYPVVAAGTAGRTFISWSEPAKKSSRVKLVRGRTD